MRVELQQCCLASGFAGAAALERLEVKDTSLILAGQVPGPFPTADPGLSLELSSGPNSWSWHVHRRESSLQFQGHLLTTDLSGELILSLRAGERQHRWLILQIVRTPAEEQLQWRAFFAGEASALPGPDLESVAVKALHGIEVAQAATLPDLVDAFCRRAASQELAVDAARLRHEARFPSVLGLENGRVLGSRLVLNWNLLLVQEGHQRFLVLQGVSSSDALLLPGLNLMVLVCHIDARRVVDCLQILCRTPEFFWPAVPATFGGYLVGHSRPYHCLYDGLLALQSVREAGELHTNDALFSKGDEAFVDLSEGLGLTQPHQLLSREELNAVTNSNSCYLLQLGFWFHTRAQAPRLRALADTVDGSLRHLATVRSGLVDCGGLEALERWEPLLWVGITGQKRSWLEQEEGTAALLNALQQLFPRLGVVFDGWTPPLVSSDYHRREARNDDRVIRRIIRRLAFSSRGRVGVLAGLPLVEKVRVGLAVDAFLANYTTGSINVARICARPGVGHMGRRMADSKHQHIHHRTREVDPAWVQDRSDATTPTGYVNYSIPWQALYNTMIEVLAELPLKPTQPLLPLPLPLPELP